MSVELRILKGALEGATASLLTDRQTRIGYETDNDVIVRDGTLRGVRIQLALARDGAAAEITMVEGEAVLCGRLLNAEARALWPAFVPLIIGECALAFGEANSARWADALRLAQVAPGETEEDAAPAQPEEPDAAQLIELSLWRRAAPYAVAAAICLFVLTGFFVRPVTGRVVDGDGAREAARTLLANADLDGLSVETGAGGELIVRGYVEREADRYRALAALQPLGRTPILQVRVGDDVARDVGAIFASHGLEADVRNLGDGAIAVRVAGRPDTLAAVRQTALRDIAGLTDLRIDALPAPDAGAPGSYGTARDERVVSVVSGPVRFVVTAGGRRYFAGSTLPSGHRIVAIENQRVMLEREGQRTELSF